MPYRMRKSGKKWCIFNEETGENKGCSDSREMGIKHMRALYAHSGDKSQKEIDDLIALGIAELPEECDECKETESFADKVTAVVKKLLPGLFKETETERPTMGLMVWKEENGDFRWIARYSNNFRDNDNPPEIISKESHLRFIERVEQGLAPYPELWLWHRPEWKIGQSDWLAWDDAGFALAAGNIAPSAKEIAEHLSKIDNVAVSHGMPTLTIKRDGEDPSIIIEHETREISPLPDWAAANKLTGFVVLGTENDKEADMAVPAHKREALINQWGVKPETLDRLEALNAAQASEAKEAGIESKEQAVEAPASTEEIQPQATETPVAEPEVAGDTKVEEPVKETTEEKSSETSQNELPPTREEVAEAVVTVLDPLFARVEALGKELATASESLSLLTKQVEAMSKSEDERLRQIVKETPAASLAALMQSRVVGSSATVVEKGDKLIEQKPKEAVVAGGTGIPFIDQMLASGKK